MAECKDGVLPGDIAFKLHDTYGFPVDLTGDVCRERGLTVDTEGFEACMLEQKNKARAAGKFKIAADVLFTGDNNEFVGYDTLETPEAKVLALYKDGIQVESAQAGDDVLVILDKTPFYAEMGGQVGDTGVLEHDALAGARLPQAQGERLQSRCSRMRRRNQDGRHVQGRGRRQAP